LFHMPLLAVRYLPEEHPMKRTKPPFRADHVGSILRTKPLKEARAKRERGEIGADALREVEDREIEKIIRKQEEIGLKLAPDLIRSLSLPDDMYNRGSARIAVAEILRRNRKITSTTRLMVSKSVNLTSAMDSRIDTDRSWRMVIFTEAGICERH